MIYTFLCSCGEKIDIELPILDRDRHVVCYKCSGIMSRQLFAPESSKLMGIKEAIKRDGKGALITESGRICEPLSRLKAK